MQLETSEHGEATVLAMSGDLEVQEIGELKAVMDEVLNRGPQPRAVLDISGVTRMTSYVIALVGFYNAQFKQAKGKLVVAGAASTARRAFELSGLTAVITMADSREEALEMLGA